MITWSDDIGLGDICQDLNKVIDKYKIGEYYIYGLQLTDRPHVRVGVPPGTDTAVLKQLFTRSKYLLEVTPSGVRYCADCDRNHVEGDCHCRTGCEYCDPDIITVGIRRDIRKGAIKARKLVKTIVFALEGKLLLEPKSKLNFGKKVKHTIIKPRKKKTKDPLQQLIRVEPPPQDIQIRTVTNRDGGYSLVLDTGTTV